MNYTSSLWMLAAAINSHSSQLFWHEGRTGAVGFCGSDALCAAAIEWQQAVTVPPPL